jgi:transposase
MRPHGSPESLERRRHRAIQLLEEGLAPVEVARKLDVDRRSVRRWRASFEAHGAAALAAKPVPGRPPKLKLSQREDLERCLLKGATAFGYHTDLWTCPRVADLIGRRFRVRYHVDHIGRLLRSMGWSPQKPERRARERDEELIQRWGKKDWPRIKRGPRV